MSRTTSMAIGLALLVSAAGVAACGDSSEQDTAAPAHNYVLEGAAPRPGSTSPPLLSAAVSWGDNHDAALGSGVVCGTATDPLVSCIRVAPVPVVSDGPSGQLAKVRTVAAGGFHAMALQPDGGVLSWGFNGQGQLGTGAPGPASAKPVAVTGPTGSGRLGSIAAISGGGTYSLAIDAKGAVWSWGDNTFAELGVGTSTGPQLCNVSSAPAAPALPGVAPAPPDPQARGGDPTPCGPVPSKVVGPNGTGQLASVVAVSGGDNHSVALGRDGTVWAWGSNDRGQLGTGSNAGPDQCKPYQKVAPSACSTKPVQVVGPNGKGRLDKVKAVAAGEDFTLALRTDGTVWAWGTDQFNDLGQNDPAKLEKCGTPYSITDVYCSTKPMQVLGPNGKGFLTGVTSVAAQGSPYGLHAAVLRSDGTVWSWGINDMGQLGNGKSAEYEVTPVQAVGPGGKGRLTGVTAIGVGGKFTMALKSDGSLWAWGINWAGELGISTYTGPERCTRDDQIPCSITPVQVHGAGGSPTLAGVSTVAVGASYTIAGLK